MCFWNKKVNFYKNETESKMENPTHAFTGHTGNLGFWTLRQDPGMRSSFWDPFWKETSRPATLVKKGLRRRCFFVNFMKFSWTPTNCFGLLPLVLTLALQKWLVNLLWSYKIRNYGYDSDESYGTHQSWAKMKILLPLTALIEYLLKVLTQ